jgi:sodium/proline symporter
MNIAYLTAFGLYFTLLLCIGLWAHQKQTSSKDFIMGNRSMNFWLVALSAHASDMSAWLFMGLPMAVYLLGMQQAWIAIGLVVGMFLNWQLVAPRLRSLTEKYDCYTLSSFFEKRFRDPSGSIRLVTASILILFLIPYLSAGMIGVGILLESLFNLNYYAGLSLALCIVVAYTFVGGFVAVAWTDLFQGIFLFCMILLVPYLSFQQLGGLEELGKVAEQKGISLSLLPDYEPLTIFSSLLLAMSWGIGYFGMPHVITKFMSIKKTSEMYKAKWLGLSWQCSVLVAAIAVGLIAILFFKDGIANPQMVFVEMVRSLFPPFFAAFILCAVLAAGMSTMDSLIIVCASVLSEDLYPCLNKNATAETKLRVSRVGVLLISLIAMILSFNKSTTIMDAVSYSWAGLGSSFGPLVLVSLYSKQANRIGALAGVITGGGIAMIWPYINFLVIDYPIPAMIPGFLCNTIAIFTVSFLTREYALPIEDEKIQAEVFVTIPIK